MENMPRDFKGVWIPKEIWLDKRLNALDKIILTEIDSLDQGEEGCWASNQYIAEFCQCSSTKVSTSISKLIEYGYLYVKSFDGRCRVLKSRLSNFERQDLKNCKADFKDLKEINIKNNTTNNINNKVSKKVSFDDLINNYTNNEELRQELKNHLATRKSKKTTLTNRAIELSFKKLDELVKKIPINEQEEAKIKIVQQSIERGWTGFFEVKEVTQYNNNKNTNWFDVIGKEEGIF